MMSNTDGMETALYFLIGCLYVSFAEYMMHRFLFHAEHSWLPDHPIAIALHFIGNGIHHAFPQDHLRLVLPCVVGYPVVAFACWVPTILFFSDYYRNTVVAGFIFGYMIYECWHYFTHFGSSKSKLVEKVKTLHVRHHYRNARLGYGITSNFWDWVFGTELQGWALE